MRPIGRLVLLQVQRTTLKTGTKPNRTYDPTPLLQVPRAAVSPEGVMGWGDRDAWVVDIHHRAHPDTKNDDGVHGVSVGFTSHYRAMRNRFGDRMVVGCAGENLIAETDAMLTWDDVSRGLVVTSPDGVEKVRLTVLKAAEPCRPFTGWAQGHPTEANVLKENLQFLQDGMRGYYLQAENSAVIEVGDLLQNL
ncbi:MAG TPA: MOSC domain-containing protein [Gemmatimonadales bacterium]|nr:MOSC domain-containing protein [Gemmatimonadales bacterium]